MLVLENVAVYGHYDQVTENPPDVLLEIFDYDPVVSLIVLKNTLILDENLKLCIITITISTTIIATISPLLYWPYW